MRVRMSILALFLLVIKTLVCYCFSLVLGFDLSLLLVKLKSMLLLRSLRLLFSRLLGWGWKGAALFHLMTHCIEGVFSFMEGDLTLYVGADGASSSKRPSIDLNFPPTDETEPETTSEPPQEELVLRREMEEHILRRLMATAPPGTTPEQLLNQARETAAFKRQIVDRMPTLDTGHSAFWRTHRYGLITDALLTNRQHEDSPKHLRTMWEEVNQPNSAIYKKMISVRQNFQMKGTFRC